jgi:hypothetical protein
MAQWYAQIGGDQYGPVQRDDIDRWVAEGRLGPHDLVWSEGMDNWRPAGEVLSGFAPPVGAPTQHVHHSVQMPDRGVIILVLGILSLVTCAVLGIPAWLMANEDLRKMRAGTMSRQNQGIVQAGRICGMIATILLIVGLAVFLVVLLVGGLASLA